MGGPALAAVAVVGSVVKGMKVRLEEIFIMPKQKKQRFKADVKQ